MTTAAVSLHAFRQATLNALHCWCGFEQAVGHPSPLLITHRLDQVTEGVVVLGKTPDFVSRFNAVISRGDNSLRKFYRALTAAPPPQGMPPAATLSQSAPQSIANFL